MTVRILIADDHEVVRFGIRSFLHGTDFSIVAEASTGDQALQMVIEFEPELVVLNVRMPDGDGLSTLARMKLDRPRLPALMFSGCNLPVYVIKAIALGASGFLLKSTTREEFVAAMQQASSGSSVWSKEQLHRLAGAAIATTTASDNDLQFSPRELEVLRQVSLGLSNKELAKALQISQETAKEHVKNILRKIGVADRTQAAVWAVRNQVI